MYSSHVTASQQSSGQESPPGCRNQQYKPDFSRPSYRTCHTANCDLLSYLQLDLKPDPVGTSCFFDTPYFKRMHGRKKDLNRFNHGFRTHLMTRKWQREVSIGNASRTKTFGDKRYELVYEVWMAKKVNTKER